MIAFIETKSGFSHLVNLNHALTFKLYHEEQLNWARFFIDYDKLNTAPHQNDYRHEKVRDYGILHLRDYDLTDKQIRCIIAHANAQIGNDLVDHKKASIRQILINEIEKVKKRRQNDKEDIQV